MKHWPFKVKQGPADKPLIEGAPLMTCHRVTREGRTLGLAVWPNGVHASRRVCSSQASPGAHPPPLLAGEAPGGRRRRHAAHRCGSNRPCVRISRTRLHGVPLPTALLPARPPACWVASAVEYKNETKTFAAEEISAMVLIKMKETAQVEGEGQHRAHLPTCLASHRPRQHVRQQREAHLVTPES